MKSSRAFRAVSLTTLGSTLIVGGACSSTREPLRDNDPGTFADASVAVAPSCGFQCSLDGRSVIDLCTGSIVEDVPHRARVRRHVVRSLVRPRPQIADRMAVNSTSRCLDSIRTSPNRVLQRFSSTRPRFRFR